MKIYTEESEGQIKITDTGIDLSLRHNRDSKEMGVGAVDSIL